MTSGNRLGGIGRAFASRNFRLYWTGNVASLLGFWVQLVAVGWLVWSITESEFWLGLIAFAARIPGALLAPVAGAVGDRFGLRRTAVIALVIGGTNSIVWFIAVLNGLEDVRWFLVFAFIQGVAVGFDLPSRQAMVPSLINSREDLSSAIAINTASFHSGPFIAPILFALVVQFLDISAAFLLNGLCFYFFAFMLGRLDLREKRAVRRGGIFSDILEGARYIGSQRGILIVVLVMASVHLLARPYIDLLPAFAEVFYGKGDDPTGYTILQWTSGAGSLLAGLYLAIRGRNSGMGRYMVWGLLSAYGVLMVSALTTNFAAGAVLLLGAGLSMTVVAVGSQSLVQSAVDVQVRGRVISLTTGMAVGLPALGSLLLGSVAEWAGLQPAIVGAALVGLACWLLARRALLREAPDMEAGRA
ncbi:MAG: MFS transporter [Rhodospirillales bacterium]|nr:MFS transporter [Rhodospirillales bacterium]